MSQEPCFTIYSADCIGKPANCQYPHQNIVHDSSSLQSAVSHDHVCAMYQNHYRNIDNFIKADCLPMDCDNDHSDLPADWKTPDDIAASFPDVTYGISYSRNHMKPKGKQSARPRFHVIFLIDEIKDAACYAMLKQRTLDIFPFFDSGACDAARFLFGNSNSNAFFVEGHQTLDSYISYLNLESLDNETESIPEGKRNTTLSHFAGKVIKRFGNTQKAYDRFLAEAEKCTPPLDSAELKTIWESAKFFGRKVEQQDGYISPDTYNYHHLSLKPDDYSDVGQAAVLAREYHDILRYSTATDYLYYNGSYWEESKPRAQALVQLLTSRQLYEVRTGMSSANLALENTGAAERLKESHSKKTINSLDAPQLAAYHKSCSMDTYGSFIEKHRESKNITAVIKEARPMLEIKPQELDSHEFLLNAPSYTFDLRQGLEGKKEHQSSDFITKMTAVSPGKKGAAEWERCLNIFFCNDTELINYVQKIVGLAVIGKVYVEALIIAYGEGRNGKSTFWNVIAKVLGSYSGNISADTLTVGCRRNVKPELAEAKGKRLLIAAELEEGMRLNTSVVKQFCSTDEIYAEKKYKDPFSYTPTHTLVLYTNHLPKVGANDPGTWRRLIIIPFSAKIEGNSDIKNYADHLFKCSGEAILQWIIEGAKTVIEEHFRIEEPQCVSDAIAAYRNNNDWLSQFLSERCDIDESLKEKSGALYNDYRIFSGQTGEYTRSTSDFYTAIETAGFIRHKEKSGSFVKGLSLKSEFLQ